jgi:hypothetical protein
LEERGCSSIGTIFSFNNEVNHHEQEDLSTQQSQAKENPRFSGAHVDQIRAGGSEKKARQREKTPFGLIRVG